MDLMVLAKETWTGFLTDSGKIALGIAIACIAQKISFAWAFKDDLEYVQGKLRELDAVLYGSVQQPRFSEDSTAILKQVRELASQVEDVMDAYDYELLKHSNSLRSQPQRRLQRFKTKTRFFVSRSSNPVVFRLRMARGIKSLKESIDKILREAQQLGIAKPVPVPAGGRRRNYDYDELEGPLLRIHRERPDHIALFGRDDDKVNIMRLVRDASNSHKLLSVVGISGMAGLGKTTLCRNIFDLDDTKKHFAERIWICVSHDFNFVRLLNSMVGFLEKCESHISEIATLELKLQDKLREKKYLLVLDDIWETFLPLWESMRSCLQTLGGVNGSTILVTSRSEKVLLQLKTQSSNPGRVFNDSCIIYKPNTLGAEDSELLFKQLLGDDLSSPMKVLAKGMLEKCSGLPLAIKTLGRLLATQKEIKTWRAIESNGIWNLEENPATASIKLSFDYLPSIQLKKCFAYCAIFEEDEVIEKNKLIQLWMAQGLLSETDVLRDEQLGEKYYQFLLSNSLFQNENLGIKGREYFKMRDVVHKLVRDISRYYHIEGQHLSLQVEEDWSSKLGNNLRTLIASFDITSKYGFWTKIKGLRALSLSGVYFKEFSDSIGELKHLRYLDISGTQFGLPPIGVANLYYLQTLRMRKVDLFSNQFKNLINLRHLWTREWFGIPVGLGMLTSLQTLPTIYLRRGSGCVSELQALNNLTGKLTIEGLGEAQEIEEIQKVELGKKENICELYLRFDDGNWRERDVNYKMMILEALEPHPNLATLAIASYKSPTLPRWMTEMTGYGGSVLDNLVSLELDDCVWIKELPSMENLHALKKLIITGCTNAKSLQNLECLTSLETLQISGCHEMENLGDISSLVRLRWLEIDYCSKMTSLPAGLSNLPNLKILKIGTFNENVSIFPFPSINYLSPLSASLEELSIRSFLMYHVENLPDQIQHLRALRSLQIDEFYNLKQMPEWLGNLTSLQKLRLHELKQVETLPSQDAVTRLSQLTTLQISGCYKLQKACSRDGSERSKIQNIPCLDIRDNYHYFSSDED